MIRQLQRAYRRRRWLKQATQVVKHREGFAARAWPLTSSAPTLLEGVVAEARSWLDDQIRQTTSPYSVGQMWIMLALRDERTKQAVWSMNLPAFVRSEAQQALETAVAAIAAVPTEEHPAATRLEVFLVSLGDIVNAMIGASTDPS